MPVTFISSQVDNTDPIIFMPSPENGTVPVLQGQLGVGQLVASGAVTVAVAKNRSTGALLQATLPGTAALSAALLVQNTTSNSFAFTFKNIAGRTWSMTQPLAAGTPGVGGSSEVVWTTGNNVNVYSTTAANIEMAKSIPGDASGGFSPVVIYHLTALDPQGLFSGIAYANTLELGQNSQILESYAQRGVISTGGIAYANFVVQNTFTTAFIAGGTPVSGPNVPGSAGSLPVFEGGAMGMLGVETSLSGFDLAFDPIVTTGAFTGAVAQGARMGNVYLDTGVTFRLTGGSTLSTVIDSSSIIWGPGTMDVADNGRLAYPAGDGTAAANLIAPITINSQSIGCVSKIAVNTITCNTTLSAAALDANLGAAASGCIGTINGGAFCNFGF